MKNCELCESPARIFCESDQASLCWKCDLKVHGANFLVARHSRNLLCQNCQSSTPWSASGPKLSPTVSLCAVCSSAGPVCRNGDEIDLYAADTHNDSTNNNQVVPWSSMPPPPEITSSSDDDDEDTFVYPSHCVSQFSSDLRFQGNVSLPVKRRVDD